MHETCYTYLESPVGRLLIAGNQTGLQWIGFPEGKGAKEPEAGWIMSDTDLRETMRQLEAYFSGKLRDFNLPLSPDGTPFQQAVWREVSRIPYGSTSTYAAIAAGIGKPSAVRAVGAANGRNPLPIVIPCHRVIGSNGGLTGYGGGLRIKQTLLALENRQRGLFPNRRAAAQQAAG